MATWERARWESSVFDGVPRRDRRSGAFERYVPDGLVGVPVVLDEATDSLVAKADAAVRGLATGPTHDLAGIARFLLRSEAIASSRIEGVAPSARQVALAELGREERVRGVGDQARLVANNLTVVREATTRLADADQLQVEDIESLHRALLPEDPRHHGLRREQNWIGGSDWHPIDATFVPPSHETVPALMADLVTYLNGATHSGIVQAALGHAQFETVHPFTDGNGRVGRALIHTVLARRGLVGDAILPISLVLSTLREEYVGGLTAYRHLGPRDGHAAHAARQSWISTFAAAAIDAAAQATRLGTELQRLREEWASRLTAHRRSLGRTRALRSDSASALIMGSLPASPVLTTTTVTRIHGVSQVAALRALDELREAKILDSVSVGPGARAYVASEVLDLITWTERRLASTKFDTSASPPNRPVAARPIDHVQRMRGLATTTRPTDELMDDLRGE